MGNAYQVLEQVFCTVVNGDRQKPSREGVVVIVKPSHETFGQAQLTNARARSMGNDEGQLRLFATNQAADQSRQGVEMFFLMPSLVRLIELHNSLFYGTIAPIRVTHAGSS